MEDQSTSYSQKVDQPVLAVLFIVLLTGALIGFLLGRWSNRYEEFRDTPTSVACSKDAKICPDGTNVGRIGPDCEFAPCPIFVLPSSTPSASEAAKDGCVRAGCSSELCVERSQSDIATTCEYKGEYGCLSEAVCERQPDGSCGWSKTSQYQECLSSLDDNI